MNTSKTKSKILSAVDAFFLTPASPRPLAVLRIGIALVLMAQAFLLRTSVMDFFAHDGLIQGDLAQALSIPHTPRISWLVEVLSPWGVSESHCIFAICCAYLTSLFFFGIGLWTRLASILAWLLHWVLMNTGYTTAYGVDLYAHVFLFYLMWMPCGQTLSVDSLVKGQAATATPEARLGLRVLQLHLCIAYLFSGIEKATGSQWWNGELLWRAFSLPVYYQFDMSWLANWPLLSKVGGWMTLLLEIGYCIFIWPKVTRKIWVLSIVGLHFGIAIFLGLGLFGSMMCLLTFAVFGVSSEPSFDSASSNAERIREGVKSSFPVFKSGSVAS